MPKYRIARVADSTEMYEIHKMAFGGDPWPGDDHEFWVAYDKHGGVAGFASAVEIMAGVVELSRCAVVLKHRGKGLQQKLIAARLKWANQEGAVTVVTHVEQYNYPSLVALLKAGFKLAERRYCPRGYNGFHFLYRGTASVLSTALDAVVTESE